MFHLIFKSKSLRDGVVDAQLIPSGGVYQIELKRCKKNSKAIYTKPSGILPPL